jgi:hypothetical protein
MESIYRGNFNESFSCFTGYVEQRTAVLDQERPILNALISTIIKKLVKTADNYIEADSGDTRVWIHIFLLLYIIPFFLAIIIFDYTTKLR